MQPELITLPHSGLQVPHTGYQITAYKGHSTHDGVAFTCTLRLDKKIIGTVENGGTGGPTLFYPTTTEYRATADAFEAFAAHCKDERGNTPLGETVLDDLITEYEFTRDITKAAKRGHVLLRQIHDYEGDDGPMGWPSVYSITDYPAAAAGDRAKLAADIAKHVPPGPLGWWQIWEADNNRWVDVTPRPAHLADYKI